MVKNISPEERQRRALKRDENFSELLSSIEKMPSGYYNFLQEKNKQDTGKSRLSWYKEQSMFTRRNIRQRALRELEGEYKKEEQERAEKEAEVKEKPISRPKMKKKAKLTPKEKKAKKVLNSSQREKFIHTHDKRHLEVVKRLEENPNKSRQEAIFGRKYPKENWFDNWMKSRNREERFKKGELSSNEKRVIKNYMKNPNVSLYNASHH